MTKLTKYDRKIVGFDLITTKDGLQKYYPTQNWRDAYKDINKYMTKNGFVWRQYSGYVSQKALLVEDVQDILIDLTKECPWIKFCMRDCTISNAGKYFSAMHIFEPTQEELDQQATILSNSISQKQETTNQTQQKTKKLTLKDFEKATHQEILDMVDLYAQQNPEFARLRSEHLQSATKLKDTNSKNNRNKPNSKNSENIDD